jgi:hypothetical protein
VVEEKFWSIFSQKGEPLPKKERKFFSQPHMTIYTPIESPCRVYYVGICCLQFFLSDFRPKKYEKQRAKSTGDAYLADADLNRQKN